MTDEVVENFQENSAIDEETGAAANNRSPANSSSNSTHAKNLLGWIAAGTTIFFIAIALIANSSSSPENAVNDSEGSVWTESRPTSSPSLPPAPSPGGSPTMAPSTSEPTNADSPSGRPSIDSTPFPSVSPSASDQPSSDPSTDPSPEPSLDPSNAPSNAPSNEPTGSPSTFPSESPSKVPTSDPSVEPTSNPSMQPTLAPTRKPTTSPTMQPTDSPTQQFFFGDEFDTYEDLGIEVSRGLSVRVIARTGERVQYDDGGRSSLDYHSMSDAAGIIPLNPDNPLEDGYVYVVNSEVGGGDGGVYGLYFDKDGGVTEYKALLTRTTKNCGGGLTPWNTYVSCEEYSKGQCWQIDPVNEKAEKTKLGGVGGGRYESVAVDNSNLMNPVFFTTEDKDNGAMRRFVANGTGWDALHSDGDESFLRIIDGSTYEWTTDEAAARESADRYYESSEGISYHEGKLYFMAKKDHKLIVLDLENMTYEAEITGKKFYGEGTFGSQPDQIMFGPKRKYLYFCEDGGSNPGVYARYDDYGTYFTLFQAIDGGIYDDDETVGIALSPDNKRFYAGIQDYGVIFELTRDDGLSFE